MQKIKSLFCKKRSKVFWFFSSLFILFVLFIMYMQFIWLGFKYDYKCYSPNKEFYVIKSIDFFSYLTFSSDGYLLLYDKNDNLLNKFRSLYLEDGGYYYWSDEEQTIFAPGDYPFIFKLPKSPGEGDIDADECIKFK